jgi:hypothetical protein
MNLRIYRVKSTLPHAYLANVCRLTDNHNEVLESIVRPDASNFDPMQITFIEGGQFKDGVPISDGSLQKSVSSDAPPTSITIDQPEHVRIETNSAYPTTLVLTDQYYAGWVATLDGVKVSILKANGFMRAVEIPTGGRHVVDFNYQPDSLKLGLIVAALAGFLTIYLGFAEGRVEITPAEAP